MPLTLIEGTFQIVGAAPDGDSIRFYPHKKSDWNLVGGPHRVRPNKSGGAQLRLDGVDALETHYSPQGGLGVQHQPLDLGHLGAAGLLEFLGFRKVKRQADETVTDATPKKVEGHIFTRFADTYGRCVAFACVGKHARASGAQVRFDVDDLRKSANYHLLEQGLAYPTFYQKLFADLRGSMSEAAQDARKKRQGVWKKDLTQSGLKVASVEELQETAYVLPKLYRRLLDYFSLNDGDESLDGFLEYVEGRDDRLLVLSEHRFTGLDNVLEVDGQLVRLTKPPEDLVFQEK